ncbi:MAG: ABC transporter permease, partial [Vicinamibacterales bacterium]
MAHDDDLRELQFHLEAHAAEGEAQGLSPAEARRRARLVFGGVSQTKEDCRAVSRWARLEAIWADLRFACRLARRTPALTMTTAVALAVGIGASSAIFAVVNGVLLKPLPYADPDRLVMVWSNATQQGRPQNTLSPADYLDEKSRNRTLEGMEGYASFLSPLEISLGDTTEVAYAQTVTSGLFDLLGRQPVLGRTFQRDRYAPEAVLSNGYWRRRFGGDRAVIGRSIRLGNQPATIVGVAPPDLVFPYPGMLGPSGFTRVTAVDMWVSMAFEGPMAAEQRTVDANGVPLRDVRFLGAIGRRRAGVSIDQVRTDLGAVARQLEAEHPQTNKGWGATINSAHDQTVGGIRPALLLLLGGVALVLLMATVNVANLMLSRSLDRNRELVARVALGASRARLLQQAFTESLLMTSVGGVLGLAVGWSCIRLLTALAPGDIPRLSDIVLDWRVAAVTMGIAVLTGLLIGVLPAATAASVSPQSVLQEYGRGTVGSRRHRRYRAGLLIAEVSFACVLTIGAGLLLRSFQSVLDVDPGFATDRLLTWQMNVPDHFRSADERRAFYRDFFGRIEQLPGVVSVGGTTRLPLGSTSVTTRLEIQGRPLAPADLPEVEFRRALHQYFEAMRIPVVRGRGFNVNDGPAAPPVVVVNGALAQRLFPGVDPIGTFVRTGPNSPWMEIVGVIGDVRHSGLEQQPAAEMYIPYLQNPPVAPFIVVRTTGDPAALVAGVRAEAQRMDKDLPLFDMRTMEAVRSDALAQRRFITLLVLLFGAMAVVLAAVGVRGVVAVWVNERMHDMSVRLALGASPRQLWRMVMLHAGRLTSVGLIAGLALTWMGMPLLGTMLFGVAPTDALTL